MKKNILLISFLSISILIFGQTINQVGYYTINGIHALSSKSNFIVLGSGDIVSLANPSIPELAGNVSISGFSTAVLAEENYAYFGTGMDVNLIIADISNPSFPLQIKSLSFPETGGGIFGLVKDDSILYLAMGSAGIYSINISDPATPSVLDTLVIENGQARDIAVQTEYAFVAHGDGLKVLNVTNPSNMQFITTIGSGYESIDINDSLVFVGKSSGGIDIFNISDPSNPLPAFSIPNTGGTAWDIKYHDNYLFLATNSKGLFIYKIESNTSKEMANFPNSDDGQSFSVCLQDSLILLSGLINGVAILQYDTTNTSIVKKLSTVDQFNIYPNPTSDYIGYENNGLKPDNIKIFDLKGNLIKHINIINSNEKIDISYLEEGQYILCFKTKDSIVTKKIVKVK